MTTTTPIDKRVLVVFESMFGSTEAVAKAIAAQLETNCSVDLVEVSKAPDIIGEETALLIVGAPTHAFSLSRPSTRLEAAKRTPYPLISRRRGVREWLNVLHRTANVEAATFDTSVKCARFLGTAARKSERELRRLGFHLVCHGETFEVTGTEGPMKPGETDKAKQWADQVLRLSSLSDQIATTTY